MTAPRPQIFDRQWAKQNGYTDDEIDAYLAQHPQPSDPYKPTGPKIAAESTLATRDKAPQRADADWSAVKGTARQVGQGATFGFADEIEAGARRVLPLSPSDHGKSYEDIRNGIRDDNQQFTQDHPYVAIGANVAGGALTGGALLKAAKSAPVIARALNASGLVPKAEATATMGQRIGAGMKAGGAAGALSGAGVADELSDVPMSAGLGGLGGVAAGGLFTGGAEVFRGARNLAAGVAQRGQSGPIRRVIQAESPEMGGARRVLSSLGRGNATVDDLAASSLTAPQDAALAELVPDNQGVRSLRIARNVGRERDAIDKSLGERAAEAPSRYAQTIANESGVPDGMDAKSVAQKAKDAVSTRVEELFGKAYAQPDVSAKPILKTVEKLNSLKLGREALSRAGELSNASDALQNIDPQNPTISVANLHYLRQGLDYALDIAEHDGDAQMVRILSEQRNTVDRAFKSAGGKLARRADRLWEQANATGESFALGEQSQAAKTKQGMVRLKMDARDPQAFQQGAASKQLQGVDLTPDGGGGQTRNPVMSTVGSKTVRARSSLGYGNAEKFGNVRKEAENIVSQNRTRNAVSGNSTTAANFSEMADEFMSDPGKMISAAVNPMSLPRVILERVWQGGSKGINAAQATEMGKLLSAGLPGQMTRDEAIAILRRMEPALVKQLERQLVTRGATSGAAVRQIGGNGR